MLNYKHFINMTDEIGFVQFSQHHRPDPESGYTLDDNARALMAALAMGDEGRPYAALFAHYLRQSQGDNGSWCNYLLHGKYYHRFDSEDSFGRAFWACSLGSICDWPDIAKICTEMLERAVSKLPAFRSARGIAYSLIGLCKGQFPFLNTRHHNDLVHLLSERLLAFYANQHSPDWKWFEDQMTYCNGILPQALIAVHSFNGSKKCLQVGLDSLRFLNNQLFASGYLNIVGNEGWYKRGGRMPLWDQQPVDAASIIFACFEAYKVTGWGEYKMLFKLAHRWYRGFNTQGLSLYDPDSGGCYDALTREGVNLNQGAEAVLSLLLSDLLLEGSISESLPAAQLS